MKFLLVLVGVLVFFIASPAQLDAAVLRVSPDTGVYTVGSTFTVNVMVNTEGKPINAADAALQFNPSELAVVTVTRTGSIFGLWTQEPSFSNGQGTVTFGGGSPSGYTGAAGSILSVTFRTLAAGVSKVTFTSGSVLAADGMGSNVLTGMKGGTYTVQASSVTPTAEYVAPINTPTAPLVTSTTHPSPDAWYRDTTAQVSWSIPKGVVAIRTLLDMKSATVPTVVHDDLITARVLENLPEGTSYFHIQFKNADGWGKITHFPIRVDSEPPKQLNIHEAESESSSPTRTLVFSFEDISPVTRYDIAIDGGESIVFNDTEEKKQYTLPPQSSGRHTVVVHASDSAENTSVATYSFDVLAIDAPRFTEYPVRLAPDVIPALRGVTVADAEVHVAVRTGVGGEQTFLAHADSNGNFTFVPDDVFIPGVYEITAYAIAPNGALSETSIPLRIIVEVPGYLRIGSHMLSILSVIIPLISLIIVLVFGVWYAWHTLRQKQKRISREAIEAEHILKSEIDHTVVLLHEKITQLQDMRKTKITKAEALLFSDIERALGDVRLHVSKEIEDIERIVE